MKEAFVYYHSLALFFTLLATYFLFVGAGKQMCYQIKVDRGDKDVKEETHWLYGVFFYGQAIPFVLTSNFVYFVEYRRLLTNYNFDDYQTI